MLPIEVVNKILVYVGELNNDMIITQYRLLTNEEYYKINFNSDLLWKIKSTIVMKRIYPIPSCDFSNKGNMELYTYFIPYYEQKLRQNIII